MAEDDLISLPGLLDKHRRILGEQLGITTYDRLLGEWLQERVGVAEATPGEAASPAEEPAQAEQVTTPRPIGPGMIDLSIQHVAIADATGRVDAVSGGKPTAQAFGCTAPAWL